VTSVGEVLDPDRLEVDPGELFNNSVEARLGRGFFSGGCDALLMGVLTLFMGNLSLSIVVVGFFFAGGKTVS